jgi:hypothetical protein
MFIRIVFSHFRKQKLKLPPYPPLPNSLPFFLPFTAKVPWVSCPYSSVSSLSFSFLNPPPSLPHHHHPTIIALARVTGDLLVTKCQRHLSVLISAVLVVAFDIVDLSSLLEVPLASHHNFLRPSSHHTPYLPTLLIIVLHRALKRSLSPGSAWVLCSLRLSVRWFPGIPWRLMNTSQWHGCLQGQALVPADVSSQVSYRTSGASCPNRTQHSPSCWVNILLLPGILYVGIWVINTFSNLVPEGNSFLLNICFFWLVEDTKNLPYCSFCLAC